VCAHEIGHLSESKSAIGLRLVSSQVFLPLLFLPPLTHSYGVMGILLAVLGICAVSLLRPAVSRRLEVRADASALAVQTDGRVYARALEKLHEAGRCPAVLPSNQSHPHLYDRMLAAGLEPSYPLPKPPASMSILPVLSAGLLGAQAIIYAVRLGI